MRKFPDAVRFCLSSAVSALAGKRFLNCLWELTYRCPARCTICSYWRNPGRQKDELQLPEIQEGLRRIHRYGCRLVNFTGGEPTLREDLEEIIAHASAMGIWTSLVTSGACLTRERVRRLKESGLDNLLVSLDSIQPVIHDAQRGFPGLHASAVECLHSVRDVFLKGHRTGGIMCVISSRNCSELEAMVRFADRLGVYVIFQPYHANKTGNFELGPERPSLAAQHILQLKDATGSMLNSRSYLAGIEPFLSQTRHAPCHAGLKYFSIDPCGYLHPCVDTPRVGHLLQDEITVVRSKAAQQSVKSCRGCWYCFRGEADTSLTLGGCLEKARLGLTVLRRNAASGSRN